MTVSRFDFLSARLYKEPMKALFKLVSALSLAAGLCSCESELPSREPSAAEKFQRGIIGQGSLYIPAPDQDASPFSHR
jgi:hypothetical protein